MFQFRKPSCWHKQGDHVISVVQHCQTPLGVTAADHIGPSMTPKRKREKRLVRFGFQAPGEGREKDKKKDHGIC